MSESLEPFRFWSTVRDALRGSKEELTAIPIRRAVLLLAVPMVVFVSLGCFWLFKLPLAYVLSHVFGMGPRGAFVAITVAYSAHAVVRGLLFRRGRWQTKTLVSNMAP